MAKLSWIIDRSGKSPFYLWLLNQVIRRAVPFNAAHGFRILSIRPGAATVMLPYWKSNMNHIRGIHACALATLCEFTTGLSIVSKLGETQYRFILKNLSVEYHYQAKMNVIAVCELNQDYLDQKIIRPLLQEDAVFVKFEIQVRDVSGNHICTGITEWQIKKWEKVNVKS